MTCTPLLAQFIEPGCTHPWAPPNPWGFAVLCVILALVALAGMAVVERVRARARTRARRHLTIQTQEN